MTQLMYISQSHARSELRVLDENRIEELAQRELEKNEAENMEHLTKCFAENLDKNQLFERLFSNGKHKQLIETHEIEISHIVEQYRIDVQKQTEKICELARDNFNDRTREISEYEEAISESRNAAQSEGIELIDIFLKEKGDFVEQMKGTNTLALNNQIDSTEKGSKCESLHQRYETLIDNVWYSLMEKETTLHERIEEIRQYFSANITTIVNDFMSQVQQLFAVIRIACEEYFKMIEEKIQANEIDDSELDKFCASDRVQQLAVIDRREGDLLDQAKEWLTTHLEKYTKFVQRIVLQSDQTSWIFFPDFSFCLLARRTNAIEWKFWKSTISLMLNEPSSIQR